MITKLKNLTWTVRHWDRTNQEASSVDTDMHSHYIPVGVRSKIKECGVKVEIYTTTTPVPLGPLMLWSPKDGGTIHVCSCTFDALTTLERIVLINISMDIHKYVLQHALKISGAKLYWKGDMMLEEFYDALGEAKCMTTASADMVTRLPWLYSRRPSRYNQTCTQSFLGTISKAFNVTSNVPCGDVGYA